MNTQILTKAEAVFKKAQKAEEARTAWQEYEANQTAINANMMRLRALRLARETAPASTVRKKRVRHA